MKKYVKMTLVVAAVIILGAYEASARGVQSTNNTIGQKGTTSVQSNVTGTTSNASTNQAQKTMTNQSTRNTTTTQNTTTYTNQGQQQNQKNQTNTTTLNKSQQTQQAATICNQVGNRYNNLFTQAWYAQHPNTWRWAQSNDSVWTTSLKWSTLANWVGVNSNYSYSYGTIYQEDTYYITEDGQPVAIVTEETVTGQYPENAAELAASGYTDDTNNTTGSGDSNNWLPLGVYTITPANSTTTPYRVFQFAVNKDGVVRGSYYDALTGQTSPVKGAVSKVTQQVAWTVGKDGSVMETELNSFTQNQSTVQIHQDSNQTAKWLMVRLNGPTTQSTTNTQTNAQNGTQTGTYGVQTGTNTGTQDTSYGRYNTSTQTGNQTGSYYNTNTGTQTGTQTTGNQTDTNQNTNNNYYNTTNGTND